MSDPAVERHIAELLKEVEELGEPLPLSVAANLFRNAYYRGYQDALVTEGGEATVSPIGPRPASEATPNPPSVEAPSESNLSSAEDES